MSSVQLRLMVMMFLQYFVWGSWAVTLGSYLGKTLSFSGGQIGSIYSTTAIATMVSPLFLGYVADRLFSTERILGVLHLVGAGLLWYAAGADQYGALWTVMFIYALCYMPTLALTNSLSFENIRNPEKDFPIIRVFGTLGWIAAGLFIELVLQWRLDPRQLLVSAVASGLLGVYCFFLPHTPPRPKAAMSTNAETGGLGQLLRQRSFLVFTIASFLVCIPLSFYYGFANLFLTEIDAPAPAAIQAILGQGSEVFFMAAMPWFIVRLGVKKMLAVGMLAWVVRYFSFGSMVLPLVLFGLFLHGICYDFFFVASQIYVDSKANLAQRARAQSFIAFITLGLGMFVGAQASGWIVDQYKPSEVRAQMASTSGSTSSLVNPADVAAPETLVWDLKGESDFAKALELKPDSRLPLAEEATQAKVPETFALPAVEGKEPVVYTRAQILNALKLADEAFGNKDGLVERSEWRAAQAHDWFHIWLWPAIAAGVTLIFFWLGFNDRIASRDAASSTGH